jgi:hypothetical protein
MIAQRVIGHDDTMKLKPGFAPWLQERRVPSAFGRLIHTDLYDA